MSSYQPSQSGQGHRRGSRRRSGGGGRPGRFPSERRAEPAPIPAKAPTFFEKIKAFFGGKPAPASVPSAAKANGRTSPAPAAPARGRSASSEPRVVRKPEAVEVTSPRLYVGNLSFDATESDLSELFNGVGQVVAAEVVSHKQTQRSKGFAFVQMQTTEEAKRAVLELHDKEFLGRKLVVSGAKSNDQHDARSEPRFAA